MDSHQAEEQKGPGPGKQSSYAKFMQTKRSGVGGKEQLDRHDAHPFYSDLSRASDAHANGRLVQANKWPAKLLSLVHPFELNDQLDECLEGLFNFNLPFLDFRIGVQGIGESFSFIISKEDQNYHNERDHVSKIINLLKLSRKHQ